MKLLYENMATHPAVVARIKDELVPLMRHTRRDRRTQREAWLRYWRIWGVEPDQESYKGRIQNYIPVGRRIAEQWVQRLMQAFFPPEQFFGVRALRQSVEQRVPLVKALFSYFFDKHMRIRRHARPWTRQLVTLGTSPVKVVWNLSERQLPIVQELVNRHGDPAGLDTRLETVLDFIGPTFTPVDLFSFYVWPPIVGDVDDATIVFEDMLLDRATIQAKARRLLDPDEPDLGHQYENIAELFARAAVDDDRDKTETERRRLADKGFTHPTDANLPTVLKPLDVTDCVWNVDLDDTGRRRWLITLGADDIPLCAMPVPWFHGKSCWLAGKFLEVENEFYGRSLFETIDKLQYFVNDVANQASDALVWSLNPISIVDMFRMNDPNSLRMRPGAKWNGEPSAVEFKEPPKDSAVTGFSAMGQLVAVMREAAEPAAPSLPMNRQRSRAAQTAVMQQLQAAEAMTPIRDVVELNEDLVFRPLLQRMHVLTWQCLDRDLVLQTASTEGAPLAERKITVADIVGDFDFRWLGSTSAMNSQVRANQMITFLGIASKLPPEMLAAEGIRIRVGRLCKAIWTEGFQLPQAEQIIEEIQKQVTIDPRVENDLFRLGRGEDVRVSEADQDDEHIREHTAYLPRLAQQPEPARLLQKHIQGHQAAKIAKHLLQVRQQMQQQAQLGAAGGGGTPPANGGPPGRIAQPQGLDDLYRSLPRGLAS